MFKEYFKENFDFIFTEESKINKFKEYEFMEINYDKFMKLNKKEKLRKLKKQYRKLSLKYHPDKKTGSNESFNTLKSSYDLLFSVWFHS
jgi:DnaJ-class molecular chaperone